MTDEQLDTVFAYVMQQAFRESLEDNELDFINALEKAREAGIKLVKELGDERIQELEDEITELHQDAAGASL